MSSPGAPTARAYRALHIDPVEDLRSAAEEAEDVRVEALARHLHSVAVDLCDTVTPYWRGLSLVERRYLRDRARSLLREKLL